MLVIVGTLSINIYRHHQNSESIAGTAKTEVQEQDVSYIATKTKEVEADQAIKPENQSVSDEPEAGTRLIRQPELNISTGELISYGVDTNNMLVRIVKTGDGSRTVSAYPQHATDITGQLKQDNINYTGQQP